jgi:hypothetical protein
MLPIRRANADTPNDAFVKQAWDETPEAAAAPAVETNLAWLASQRSETTDFATPGDVVLLGGASLADFRVRVAQSHVRDDLTPSYWSLVGVLDEVDRVLTAPLWPVASPEIVPITNGIAALPIAEFDDPALWPNIAVVRFPGARRHPVVCVDDLRKQRPLIDLPALVLHWLAFVWGAGASPNPLVNGSGIPSAVMTETAFGIAEVELTPGLAASSSCPEAIYQSAKWWHDFYERAAGGRRRPSQRPIGHYLVRQTAATYREPERPPLNPDAPTPPADRLGTRARG